jgi:hypothetical protein
MLRKCLARMTARAFVIVIASALLGLAVNAVRPDGLPLVQAAQQSIVTAAPAAARSRSRTRR